MKNFFELFSLKPNFEIDQNELEEKYLDFQKQFHPDSASSADIEKSITINEAYKTLSDDFLRACYLLALKNIDIRHDEKVIKPSPATLMEVLELQEKIAEISDKNEIENLRKEISKEFKSLILDSMKQLEANEIQASAQILVKAKYLKKSLEDLKIRKNKLN
ncbi:MAG: Fe-S protein assembly co-chaperone HscB [Pseudomonadota bacterium]